MIRAVVLDIGETVLDDTTEWGRWADWLGIRRHTFSALMGAMVARGSSIAEVLARLAPGMDVAAQHRLRERAGCGENIVESDLYPDVRPALTALRDAGFWVGLAGNQTARAGQLLRELHLPVDGLATSGEWQVRKPDQAFFTRLVDWVQCEPPHICYVGDHPVNDVFPAKAAGLMAVHLSRGPWGRLYADDPDVLRAADASVGSLVELPALLTTLAR